MNTFIVDETRAVTLVGAGQPEPQDLEESLSLAPVLVAADGGASLALAQGRVPEAVIGDFDSISKQSQAQIPKERLFPIREQETTDFDKALRSLRAPLILGVGFLGGRLDHQLAALNTLVQRADRRCILIGAQELVFHAPQHVTLPLAAGDVVSLFPLAPVRGSSTGLEWPIDGLLLEPGARIGTSNRATGPVQLATEGPGLLAMVPRHYLAQLTQALRPVT